MRTRMTRGFRLAIVAVAFAFGGLVSGRATLADDLWSQWTTCDRPDIFPPAAPGDAAIARNAHSPPAAQNPQTAGTSNTIFDELAACNIGLHSKINESTQGASLGYTEAGQGSKKNGFASQFALVWRPPPVPIDPSFTTSLFPIWSIDGNIATQSARKDTFLNIRPEFGIRHIEYGAVTTSNPLDLGTPSFPLSGEYIRFGPFFEATQDFDVQNIMFEGVVTYTNTGGIFPIGRYFPLVDGIRFRFRPYATVQVGTNIQGLELTKELDRTRLRLIVDPVAEFSFDSLRDALHLTSAVLRLEEIYTILPLEGITLREGRTVLHSDNTHSQFSASLAFGLNKNLALQPSYTTGDIAPTFARNHIFMISLTAAFGPGGGGERLF